MDTTIDTKQALFRSGQLDSTFTGRAVENGHPYTTRPLVVLSAFDIVRASMVDDAADRARRYLTASEIAEWRAGMASIIGRIPATSERAQYLLGQMSK